MNFSYLKYLPLIIIFLGVFLILHYRNENKKNHFVKKFWFLETTRNYRFYLLLFYISLSFLAFSLLDFRGPEIKLENSIMQKRTLILIDSSLSMQAEDVYPSRFDHGVFLARHFVSSASGHKIAIVLFSDTQKLLVPFTDDYDFLDSRLAGLKERTFRKGGSNIQKNIGESLAYLKIEEGDQLENSNVNILLITDSDETEPYRSEKVSEDIKLGVVAVGTLKGSSIPIRNENGDLIGHKKFEGKEVVSKINENFLKELNEFFPSYRYWISLSNDLPTDEILKFFNAGPSDEKNKEFLTVRPVWGHYFIVAFILIYILSSYFYNKKTFTSLIFILFILFSFQVKSSEVDFYKSKFKEGNITKSEKMKLAQILLSEKDEKSANVLFDEIVKDDLSEDLDPKFLINYGTGKAFKGDFREMYNIYKKVLLDRGGELSDLDREVMDANLYKALNSQSSKKKSSSGKGDENKEDDSSKSKNKNGEDQNKKLIGKRSFKGQKGDKVPEIVKQIKSEDRQLQRKYMDVSTQKSGFKSKDW